MVPHVPLADLLASCLTVPSCIPGFRKTFGEKQREQREELISEHGLSISEREIAGVKVLVIAPRKIKAEYENKVLLNIHGGAFVLGSARDRTGLTMAAEMGIRVLSIEYTLSPEVRYPVAIKQCPAWIEN
jgi:monoterpene epsilon-lactone hydrolase